MNRKQIEAAKSEFRAAKAEVDALCGRKVIGLTNALDRIVEALPSQRFYPLAIRSVYAVRGADVSCDALKSLAFARLAKAYIARR